MTAPKIPKNLKSMPKVVEEITGIDIREKPRKRAKSVDVEAIDLNANELSTVIGCVQSTVIEGAKVGRFTVNDKGRYPLVENVRNYIRRLKESSAGRGKSDLELENLALKNEKIKEDLRSWRMQRDREVGLAIIQSLRTAMQRVKTELGMVPAVTEAVDGLIEAIGRVDVDGISFIVEGEDDDETDR